MWPFRPKHTVDSVLRELVEGYYSGTVVIPGQAESPAPSVSDQPDPPTEWSAAPTLDGRAFIVGYVPDYTRRSARKIRVHHEAGAIPRILVATRAGGYEDRGYVVSG